MNWLFGRSTATTTQLERLHQRLDLDQIRCAITATYPELDISRCEHDAIDTLLSNQSDLEQFVNSLIVQQTKLTTSINQIENDLADPGHESLSKIESLMYSDILNLEQSQKLTTLLDSTLYTFLSAYDSTTQNHLLTQLVQHNQQADAKREDFFQSMTELAHVSETKYNAINLINTQIQGNWKSVLSSNQMYELNEYMNEKTLDYLTENLDLTEINQLQTEINHKVEDQKQSIQQQIDFYENLCQTIINPPLMSNYDDNEYSDHFDSETD